MPGKSLSPEGDALLRIFYASNLSTTAMNDIIRIVKHKEFVAANLEDSMEEIVKKEEQDNPPMVSNVFIRK
jgi:predicted transcriptional regulator